MQIVQKGSYYHFFCAWGRTGTSIGGTMVKKTTSEDNAIEMFAEKFKEMTANDWEDRMSFEKKGGKYFMVDLDDGNENAEELQEVAKRRDHKKQKLDEAAVAKAEAEGKQVLDPRVRALVELLFDKDMMKTQLKDMNVDVKKMPLGKISKKQIQCAYAVLNSLTELIQAGAPKAKFVEGTNKFYTLVPHDFGEKDPPLIDSLEALQAKMQLLDVLCDLEIANSLMKEADSGEGDKVLKNYHNLKTRITPLDKDSERYKILLKYATDTHDATHFPNWTFTIDDIFEVERENERARFEPWSKNENRHLLWHGSRLTNYVGILSQGMRIAPPEAPKTGYRFGKGVYLADTVSKSAHYCFTTPGNPQGVMILNEVALGVPNKVIKDVYMEKAPDGTHCTWAEGMFAPDPKAMITIDNDVHVPTGRIISTDLRTACLHNEFIVYDVAQLTIRYLFRATFHHGVHK
eukprot:TRINITY_DN10637_c0_g1_i6.p1 TRINITY_DN10637_c0_g1~~TRINITY_DN10637_c0_g1_i6.p1  ORF type:complete len:460 (+),score=145.14 TRINITY_DN10637_c0_g1_i6:146-1525(+)